MALRYVPEGIGINFIAEVSKAPAYFRLSYKRTQKKRSFNRKFKVNDLKVSGTFEPRTLPMLN